MSTDVETGQWMTRQIGAPGTHLELFFSLGDAHIKSFMRGGWMDAIQCGSIGNNYLRQLTCTLYETSKHLRRTAIQYASKPRLLTPKELRLVKKEIKEWEEGPRQIFMKCIFENPNSRVR
jgi:hypothetical protein